MPSFTNTPGRSPFGTHDQDSAYISEADVMPTYIKRMLGDDIVGVELTNKQIWACLEQATFVFGGYVNRYQAKSQLTALLGIATGSLSGSEGRSQQLPRQTLEFLRRQSEAYGYEAGVGGSFSGSLGYFELANGQQDYNIYNALKDGSGNVLATTLTGSHRSKIKIMEVMHFAPSNAHRFFDASSALNYLSNEFAFESFSPETLFYVLPVYEDVIRAQQMNLSHRVRRSNYSYRIFGDSLRIFPTPTVTTAKKLWVRYLLNPNPYSPTYPDESVFGVSNISNVPFGEIKYAGINSIGRSWIREYTLALCKEVLGLVRSKFKSLPIPNVDVQLNGDDLISQAREDKERLSNELKELLESSTFDKLAELDATKAENLIRQLRAVPIPLGKAIVTW